MISIIKTPPLDMELKSEARLPALNAFILNSSSLNIGSATCFSINGKATRRPAPDTRAAITQGLPQPIAE
ncbi:MAG: hypothetical protein ACLP53_19315, partial [Isosphaeraceae bacterium]